MAAIPVVKIAHPAAVDRAEAATTRGAQGLGAGSDEAAAHSLHLTPVGMTAGLNFGAYWTEIDYARIPRWDLPSAAPAYAGDDSWGRAANPRHNNCCERPSPGRCEELAPRTGSWTRRLSTLPLRGRTVHGGEEEERYGAQPTDGFRDSHLGRAEAHWCGKLAREFRNARSG